MVEVLAQVPLADHVGRIALSAQRFRDRRDVLRQLHRIARETRIGVGHPADAGGMRISPREECRPRRRAHRHHMEIGVAQPLLRQAIDIRRRYLGAEASEIRIADVVAEDDDDMGAPAGASGREGQSGFDWTIVRAILPAKFDRHGFPR